MNKNFLRNIIISMIFLILFGIVLPVINETRYVMAKSNKPDLIYSVCIEQSRWLKIIKNNQETGTIGKHAKAIRIN